jgi:hypothetical protein
MFGIDMVDTTDITIESAMSNPSGPMLRSVRSQMGTAEGYLDSKDNHQPMMANHRGIDLLMGPYIPW